MIVQAQAPVDRMPKRRTFLTLALLALAGGAFAYPLINPSYGGGTRDALTAHQKLMDGSAEGPGWVRRGLPLSPA